MLRLLHALVLLALMLRNSSQNTLETLNTVRDSNKTCVTPVRIPKLLNNGVITGQGVIRPKSNLEDDAVSSEPISNKTKALLTMNQAIYDQVKTLEKILNNEITRDNIVTITKTNPENVISPIAAINTLTVNKNDPRTDESDKGQNVLENTRRRIIFRPRPEIAFLSPAFANNLFSNKKIILFGHMKKKKRRNPGKGKKKPYPKPPKPPKPTAPPYGSKTTSKIKFNFDVHFGEDTGNPEASDTVPLSKRRPAYQHVWFKPTYKNPYARYE